MTEEAGETDNFETETAETPEPIAEVVTDASEPEQEQAAEPGKAVEESKEEPKEVKKPSRLQRRFSKLTTERDTLREENTALKAKAEAKETKEPKEEEFEEYGDYLDALEEHESKPKAKSKIETSQERAATAIESIKDSIGDEELPSDYNELVQADDLAITVDMLEAVAESDEPEKVLYYLAKNKSLAKDIAGKTVRQQVRAIAKLEGKVSAMPPKKASKAPAPISPVGNSSSGTKHLKDMSFSEHEAYMNKLDT